MSTPRHIVSLAGLLVSLCSAAAAAQVVIKLGTVAPEGSIWHDVLLETRQQWREISDGEVELRIYAGGVLGGEDEMVRKMQRRGLDALAVSGSGLPLFDSIVGCLNLPMLFNSYEELDFVRNEIAPELEQSFEQHGYKILSWAEAGWVHFFAKSPVRTPGDLRQLRLWTGAGDSKGEQLAKELGFRVVPLPATDMLTGLQTGLIEVIDVPPLFALLDRGYQAAPYMTALKFAPLNAATVMTLAAWERLPAGYRDRLAAAARASAATLRGEIHRAEEEAIGEMVARGLTVVDLDAQTVAQWRSESVAAYPRLDCALEHPALFDKVLRLQRERAATDGSD
ncbi:MAG TPA: TRAP transporter substrate-binding protein DctP [Gammaproteobacteria bacterium]|nr:TRAP transporter substrate-binding protein DctP [Gammaproteobacteria bacterium]